MPKTMPDAGPSCGEMTLRTQRRLLWTASGLLALAVVCSGAGLVAWPIEGANDGGAADHAAGTVSATDSPRDRPPLSAYAVVWQKDLQRPLYDPAPPVAQEKPPPKPEVTLVGTVIEQGFTYALLKTKAGQVKMASPGDTVDGAEVLGIAPDSATVRFAGHEHVLKVRKEGSGP